MFSFQSFCHTFWDPDFWLPVNITWADLKSNDKVDNADHDLLFLILITVLILIVRYCLERIVFIPMGLSLGIKESKTKKVVPNDILEIAYRHNKMNYKELVGMAKQLDWTERQVERWLRLRRSQDKTPMITKFCENGWRFTYYSLSFLLGLYVLWDKPWLWNADHCWKSYPHQIADDGLWWYYMISAAFYWSLTVSQFYDVKRKDFWEMFAHHVFTICLIYFSWICHFHRIGSLILVLHDVSDIFLELAKMANYTKYHRLCDVTFTIFAFVWLFTRTGIFPFVIIHSTLYQLPFFLDRRSSVFPAYYVFNGLLIFLLGLHLFWTYLLIKTVQKALSTGELKEDIRSSSSEGSISSNSVSNRHNGVNDSCKLPTNV